jgi:CHAT domain-containing protein
MMHAVGLGVLHVTYDETGEINSVKTENEPGATDTDVPGIEISTAVTRVMQNLTRLTGIVGDVQEGSFDALFEEDEALAALRARARLGHVAEPTMPALLQRRIDLASELIRRIADHPDHQRQADQLLRNQLDGVVSDDKWSAAALASASDKTDRAAAIEKMIELAGLWHRVNTIMRPEGLPLDLWNEWIGTLEWIGSHDEASDAPAVRTAIANFNAQVLKEPPRLLSSAGWLNSSALSNPGYWSNYAKNVVIPKALAPEARLTAILVRRNGHVVVGSNVGFAVMRRGFWEWFGFDPAQQRFSRSMDTGDVGPGSFITSLAEDSQGRLWLGQSNGIALISADYELQPRVWRSGNDGLIQGRVESLEINGNALAVGGDSGLALFDLKTLSAHIVSAKAVRSIRMAADGFLIIGRNTLRVLRGGEEVPLTDFRVVDAFYHPDERQLFVIQGEKVLKRNLTGLTADEPIEIEPFRLVYGQEAIEHTAPPTGFAYMQVLDDEKALGVLTDQGVSFYRRNTFEHLTLPGGNRRKGIEQMAVRDGRAYFITSTGIAAHEAGQARLAISGRVYDVLTDPEIGFTFAATGYGIEAINHNDDEPVAQRFSGDAARFLKLAPDGALVTHDGNTILRYQRGSNTAQELFSAAEQTLAGEFKRGNIEDIMVQSDGTVWVVAGASLFRWKSKEDFEEFSIFKDERRFPVNSQWLSKIVETVDGRILLVASNEGHVTHSGVSLAGGLFEYVDGAFEKSSLDESIGNWFLTSYTPIDDEWAIAGSLGGFSIQKGNRLEDYDELKEASYMAVRQNRPALYLGTRGAKIGDKTWLFGSASGVIGYHDGRWFDPDRLNWMLPAQDFADYGSRVVHAVESDAKGRIYVATDWGLTVYDPLGAGPEKFLISERLGNFAFANVEKQRMGQVNDVLSDAIPDTGKGAKLAKSLENSRKQIALLEERIANAETVQTEDEKQLTKKIRRARQKEIALLAKLEHEYPVLFNMLQLNPLDLHAVASKLPDGVKVAQYLPTDRVLYINLVSNLGTEIREIRVDRAELEAATVKAAQLLAAQALGMVRGGLNFAVSDAGKSVGDAVSEAARRAQNAELNKTLAWLYDQLLRPIEHEISADETLVVSPVGVLSYIPYGALVSNIEENKVSYAVERFHFATAPSLYSVDRLSEHRESLASSHLVFGDPDGSLPAARQEASDIAEVLADDIVELRIGEEATYDELVQGAEDARFIHLAMHGKLDARSPRDSYLLLADDQRMSLPQIMTLPLQDADLVFLSACETGIGTDGLEYRTIAHAFAHAGAPTVIATLWQVDDAATRELAVAFYAAKVDGESKSRALASAQRAMLSGGGTYALPGYWAGFTIFGRP